MKKLAAILSVLFLGIQTVLAAPKTQSGFPVIPPCDEAPDLPICEVSKAWDVADLEARETDIWLEGDELTVVYEDSEAEAVFMSGGIRSLIRPIPYTDLWVMTFRLEDASQAVLTYSFYPIIGGQVTSLDQPSHVWRGPNAPELPPTSDPLQGTVETVELESLALAMNRTISVYLPPNHDKTQPTSVLYMVDGQAVAAYAPFVEARILDGSLPPLIIIGDHAQMELEGTRDPRAAEYLPGYADEYFARHEQFFIQELIPWAEATYGASSNREDRVVFGLSNGAAFSSYIGVNYPDLFGTVIAFSQGWEVTYPTEEPLDVRFYLLAGTLESNFHNTTVAWQDTLAENGLEVTFKERVAAHDPALWREELPAALVWAFN